MAVFERTIIYSVVGGGSGGSGVGSELGVEGDVGGGVGVGVDLAPVRRLGVPEGSPPGLVPPDDLDPPVGVGGGNGVDGVEPVPPLGDPPVGVGKVTELAGPLVDNGVDPVPPPPDL